MKEATFRLMKCTCIMSLRCVLTVMLQPVSGGQRPDADCAHKFIVETVFTPDGELTSLERLVNHHTALHHSPTRWLCSGNNIVQLAMGVGDVGGQKGWEGVTGWGMERTCHILCPLRNWNDVWKTGSGIIVGFVEYRRQSCEQAGYVIFFTLN